MSMDNQSSSVAISSPPVDSQQSHVYPAGLVTKLVGIIEDCKYVQKTGRNQKQNYSFVEESEVLKVVRSALVKHRVFIQSSVEDSWVSDYIVYTSRGEQHVRETTVKMKFVLIDADTGESMPPAYFTGSAAVPGDKQLYVAETNIQKYFLLKTFLIPSGDDAEATDEPETIAYKPEDRAPQTPSQPEPAQPAPAQPEPAQANEKKGTELIDDAWSYRIRNKIVNLGIDATVVKDYLKKYYKIDKLMDLNVLKAQHLERSLDEGEFFERVTSGVSPKEEDESEPEKEPEPAPEPETGVQSELAPEAGEDDLGGEEIDREESQFLDLYNSVEEVSDIAELYNKTIKQYGRDHRFTEMVREKMTKASNARAMSQGG